MAKRKEQDIAAKMQASSNEKDVNSIDREKTVISLTTASRKMEKELLKLIAGN